MKRLAALLALALAVLFLVAPPGYGDRTPGAAAQTPAWENIITPGSVCSVGYGCMVIATDPTHPGTLYLGADAQGILKSLDYGAHWARVDQPWGTDFCGARGFDGRVWTLAVDANGDVYANNGYGCGQGLFRSTDGGVHWTPLASLGALNGPDINHVDIDPLLPGHLLVSYHSGVGGVSESFDHGATWAFHPMAGPSNWAFFVNSTTWIDDTQAGIWRTTDGGATWAQVSIYPAMHGNAGMYASASGLYLTSEAGVLRSTDAGASWSLIMTSNNPDGVMAVIGDGTYLYARTANTGVASTGPLAIRRALESNPTVWSDYAQPLANGPMSMASDGSYVYSSNWNAGVFRLAIGGAVSTFTPSPTTPTPPSTPTTSATPTISATTPAGATATVTSSPTAAVTPTPSTSPTSTPNPALLWTLCTNDGGLTYTKAASC